MSEEWVFEFYESEDEELTLESAVFQALGASSVCWESLEGAGVFNSTGAAEIGIRLIAKIKEFARDNKIV